jgi:hypothetical protein
LSAGCNAYQASLRHPLLYLYRRNTKTTDENAEFKEEGLLEVLSSSRHREPGSILQKVTENQDQGSKR